jgi:hypothetical protein
VYIPAFLANSTDYTGPYRLSPSAFYVTRSLMRLEIGTPSFPEYVRWVPKMMSSGALSGRNFCSLQVPSYTSLNGISWTFWGGGGCGPDAELPMGRLTLKSNFFFRDLYCCCGILVCAYLFPSQTAGPSHRVAVRFSQTNKFQRGCNDNLQVSKEFDQ